MVNQILIVEDDGLFALEVRMMLAESYTEAKIVVCTTAKAAIEQMKAGTAPDVLLVDVLLDEKQDSLTIGQYGKDRGIPVLYMTAHQRQDLFRMSLQTHPANYLLKPFSKLALQQAIDMAVFNRHSSSVDVQPNSLLLKDEEGVTVKVLEADIVYIMASGNYCHIYTQHKKFVHRIPMKNYTSFLTSDDFVRVFRNYVVNVTYLTAIDTYKKEVVLGDVRLPYSGVYKGALLSKFMHK